MSCYDDAGPWNGGASCTGSLTPGAQALGELLVTEYGGSFQGYNCRPNTADGSQLSVHGTGRAVDFFPPSSAVGDTAAAFLVDQAAALGIQLVIWNRRDWSCYGGWSSYGGPNPHTDHVHVELTVAASRNGRAIPKDTTGRGGLPDVSAPGPDPLGGLGDAVGTLTDPNTWRRAGLILGGGLLFLVGVSVVAAETGFGSGTIPTPTQLRKVLS